MGRQKETPTKTPKSSSAEVEMLRMGVRGEMILQVGVGHGCWQGTGVELRGGGMALAPESREGFWDLGGDPQALPAGARQGLVPLTQLVTLIPKYLRSCSRKTKVRTV